jgi:Flp pilus assembly pilin Flp
MDRFNAWVGSLILRSQDLKKEDGQTFVEYALVLAVIVVGLLLLITWSGLGAAISDAFKVVENALPNS